VIILSVLLQTWGSIVILVIINYCVTRYDRLSQQQLGFLVLVNWDVRHLTLLTVIHICISKYLQYDM